VHGKTLQRLGLGEDVVFCSHLNQYRMVPQLRDNAVVSLDDD
jgi:phosphosulfolactate phosphohydrolase-like enzyme